MAPEAAVTFTFQDEITFFHPGSNWSGVKCPRCSADLGDWWGDAMDGAAETSFEDLCVTTPCCGLETSLNDLDYVWPAAFGRFVLEALNPNIGDTSEQQDQRLAETIGAPLRKVLVHI